MINIQDRMEKVSAFVAIKSSVNLAQLDYNTFLDLYQYQLIKAEQTPDQIKTSVGTLKTELEAINEIYK